MKTWNVLRVVNRCLCLVLLLHCPAAHAQELNTILMNSTFEIAGPSTTVGETSVGTVFLMGRQHKENPKIGDNILITAAHVLDGISGDSATLMLRQTDNRGGYSKLPFQIPIRHGGENLYVKNSDVDVAVMYVALPAAINIQYLPTQFLATDARLQQLEVHPGDELFCLGFPLAYDFNGFPILRTGTLASYPLTPSTSVKQYLFTLHIFPGNSGGPVYFSFPNRVYGGTMNMGVQQGVIGLISQQISSTMPGYSGVGLDIAVVVPSSYILSTINMLPPTP